MRSAYQYNAAASNTTDPRNSNPTRYPPSSHPIAPIASAGTASRSQAFRTLRRTATRGRIPLRLVVAIVRVVLGKAVRRPVGLRRVASARAVQRGAVLQRDQDVPVQLDVCDVLDVAVGRPQAVLVLTAAERDPDLLTLV